MKKIKLLCEYLHSPIWAYGEKGLPTSEPNLITQDLLLKELAGKFENIYSSYYEFDSHDMPCWFNYEQQFKDRFIMRDLLRQLVNRLNEINDGSFVVEPSALDFYNELCTKDHYVDLNK